MKSKNKKRILVWGGFLISVAAVLYLISLNHNGLIAFGFILGVLFYKICIYLGMINKTKQKAGVAS